MAMSYSEQQRKEDEAETNKLIGEIDEIKRHRRNREYMWNTVIFFMLAVALLVVWL